MSRYEKIAEGLKYHVSNKAKEKQKAKAVLKFNHSEQ